eukprot:TRINITY_DN9531_c0_g1_i1.p1 TRINITY_DN9531_c0_g1~~TRINITY_DN9531_c0_g1_i1.p1  ORF type:complete len:455 (+),score=107.69 TRINITY_DN9531_c0_g1_i1:22-1386(+)
MKSIALILGCALAASALQDLPHWARGGHAHELLATGVADGVQEMHFDAFLDNNDFSRGMFPIKYYVLEDLYNNHNGVCFFEMGGEGPNSGIGKGYMYQLAHDHKALIVSTEHRFYGESLPKGGLSVDNLKFLTSHQALADAARLIKLVNATAQCRKWVAFGGSYSGALSAWFRSKYPNVIDAALSSSGVVNAILDFVEFDEQVATAIGAACANELRHVTNVFGKALGNGDGAKAKALFNVRANVNNGDFAYMLADSAAMADQYNQKAALCHAIQGVSKLTDEVAMQVFANFTIKFWGADFAPGCFYDRDCVKSQPEKWQPTSRSWWWQKCFELAYWQNSPKTGSLRLDLLSMEYHTERCQYMFYDTMFPMTNETNTYYGGADVRGSRIYFSDFSDDPWQQASVRTELSEDLPYQLVVCDGCGHCDDLHAPSTKDPPALAASRTRFESYLNKWLQ